MKRILFIPNYLGGGFGHIGRCIALAEEFRLRGGYAAFVVNGPHSHTVSSAGFNIFTIKTPPVASPGSSGAAYIYVPGMNYQIVRDGFDRPGVVKHALDEALAIIQKTRPDVIVGDGHPLTMLAGKSSGIPVVQLVKSAVHPHPEKLVWWENQPEGLVQPDPRPVFNPVLKKNGLQEISRAEELLDGDLLIIPSIPELDPMTPLPPRTHYTGAIIRQVSNTGNSPDWMRSLDEKRPVVYITVGGAASHSGGNTFYKVMADAFGGSDYQIIISAGGKEITGLAGDMPGNVRIVKWVPGIEMISRSSIVIHHGGYTRMEILSQGKPSIVVPFHSEQEYYGRILEKAGVAKLVHYSTQPYVKNDADWKGGGIIGSRKYTVHVRPHMTLTSEQIRKAVDDVMCDGLMKNKALSIKSILTGMNGPGRAIDLIINNI
jgi:UDP:flavonoid glycosyltransferase YjiC (YdhE family)